MAVHITVFGSFGDPLKPFADMDGYIPERGDHPASFSYPGGWFGDHHGLSDYDTDEWEFFVGAAEKWLALVESRVAEWRDRGA